MNRYPVKSMQRLHAARTKQKFRRGSGGKGDTVWVYVLDMAQNLSGYPEIKVKGRKGDKVKLTLGESLNDRGLVSQSQSGGPHYYEYTLKGAGEEYWRPRFSYYGFRYIQVEGAVMRGGENPDNLPVINEINSCFVHNSAENIGHFESSNTIFNNAHKLVNMAVRSNMQSVFTDCPHREKLGWLEQVQLCGQGLMYNYDLSRLFPKVMRDMADEQYPNGLVPTTSPMYVEFSELWNDSPEWGSTSVILPFLYYWRYGDDRLIREYYPVMKKYVDYLESRSDNHIVMHGLGDWYDYGDFKSGFSRNTPVPLVGTAHLYLDIQLLIRAATMLGIRGDIDYYTQLGNEVNKAFHERFFQGRQLYLRHRQPDFLCLAAVFRYGRTTVSSACTRSFGGRYRSSRKQADHRRSRQSLYVSGFGPQRPQRADVQNAQSRRNAGIRFSGKIRSHYSDRTMGSKTRCFLESFHARFDR